MDTKKMSEQLRQLQTWRNQVVGIGLLPPDLGALIALVEDADGSVKAMTERRTALADEVVRLDGDLTARRQEGERQITESHAVLTADLDAQIGPLQERAKKAKKMADDAERNLAEKEKFATARAAQLDAELKAKSEQLAALEAGLERFKKQHGLG